MVFVRASTEDEVKQRVEAPHSTPHATTVLGPSNLKTPKTEVTEDQS